MSYARRKTEIPRHDWDLPPYLHFLHKKGYKGGVEKGFLLSLALASLYLWLAMKRRNRKGRMKPSDRKGFQPYSRR